MLTRITRAWRGLAPEGRLAAGAALLLFVTMFLPWYQINAVVDDRAGGRLLGKNMTAFGTFSFVEAAVLLVAIAVLFLLFARAEGRAFHLPGGDGTIVMVAGGWTVLLLVWRLFDKPDINGDIAGNVGIQWGIFFALAAAGLLAYAGARMRAAHRPEPPVPAEVGPQERAARRRRERPAPGTEATRPLPADPPAWEEPPREPAASPLPPSPLDEEPPTRRLPEPPRDEDEPTRRIPPPPRDDEPTRRIPQDDAPTTRLPSPSGDEPRPARRRARPPLDTDVPRLWDDR